MSRRRVVCRLRAFAQLAIVHVVTLALPLLVAVVLEREVPRELCTKCCAVLSSAEEQQQGRAARGHNSTTINNKHVCIK